MIREQVVLHRKRRERVLKEANFIIENSRTTREAAAEFGMSKTTIYRDMTIVLPMISPELTAKVKAVLQYNRSIKHLRGGETTRNRYCKRLQRPNAPLQ
jgi:putative DeoR family transcriptional regulator (stage III sporulation protein D)